MAWSSIFASPGYSGVHVGTRPVVHGAPAASAFVSSCFRSVSTSVRRLASTGANCCAAISYPCCCVPVGAEVDDQRASTIRWTRSEIDGGTGS